MFHVAISQLTTFRWELAEEIGKLAEHGFDRLSLWRPKLSDLDVPRAARLLADAGVRVSSLQWAGGFTGGDGRSYQEGLADALEAIDDAAVLGAAAVVIHSGCRGGHTRAHARRLLVQALETLVPAARAAGVTLALRPLHPVAAERCSFLTTLAEGLEVVDQIGDPAVRLAVDLWQFGDGPELMRHLPRLAAATVIVQMADRVGPPTCDLERRPAGRGTLPLQSLAIAFVDHGFTGCFEFDPIGEEVAFLGYDEVLAETRRTVDAVRLAVQERMHRQRTTVSVRHTNGVRTAIPENAADAPAAPMRGDLQFRSAGSRRSQASSQTVSPG